MLFTWIPYWSVENTFARQCWPRRNTDVINSFSGISLDFPSATPENHQGGILYSVHFFFTFPLFLFDHYHNENWFNIGNGRPIKAFESV